MKPYSKHIYGLTLVDEDEPDLERGYRLRSMHPFHAFRIGDEIAPYSNIARGRRLVVTRVEHFVSGSDEELDEVIDDVTVYYEEAGPHLRSVPKRS